MFAQDGNGRVDMNEFLIGMTANSSSKADGNIMGSKQLQKSFSDFANWHRRRKIVASLTDTSPSNSELNKYKCLHKLFNLNYLNAESQDEDTLVLHGSVANQIEHAKEELEVFKKEIAYDYLKRHARECKYANSAAMYFVDERQRNSLGQRHNNIHFDESTAKPRKEYSIEASLRTTEGIHDINFEAVSRRLENKMNHKLAKYSILTGSRLSTNKTFTPLVESTLPNCMSAPSIPTCFGPLTSGGETIKMPLEDMQLSAKRAGGTLLRRSESYFPTKNIPLEVRLVAQTLKGNTSCSAINEKTLRPPLILAPISTKQKLNGV